MGEQYGYLSRYKTDSTNEHIEEEGFGPLLNRIKIAVTRKNAFLRANAAVLEGTSKCLSYMYYPRNIRDYTLGRNNTLRSIPVFGVKDATSLVKRTLNFYAYYLCHPDTLMGQEFFSHVFGTDFITEKEATELADPRQRLGVPCQEVPLEIQPEDRKTVCRIVERLWTLQEENPSNRIVFLLRDAQTRSREILKQVYMLLPPRLRLEIGFWTNVKPDDFPMLFEADRLSVYLMTMDSSTGIDKVSVEEVPITIIDLEHPENHSFNQERLQLLEKLCSIVGEKTDICLQYAEEQVLQETKEVISFRLYERTIRMLWSPELYWWKRASLTTIEKVQAIYREQRLLMEYEPLYRDALCAFYMELMPEYKYTGQIIQMIRHEEYPNRTELLDFLSQDLKYSTEITAIEKLIHQMEDEQKVVVRECEDKADRHERKSLTDQKNALEHQWKEVIQELTERKEKEKKDALDELQSRCNSEYQQLKEAEEQRYKKLQEDEAQRYQDLKESEEQRYKKLQADEAQRYQDLKESEEQRYKKLQEDEAQRYRDLKESSEKKYQELESECAQKYEALKASKEREYQDLKKEADLEQWKLHQELQDCKKQLQDRSDRCQEYERNISDLWEQLNVSEEKIRQFENQETYRQLQKTVSSQRQQISRLQSDNRNLEQQIAAFQDKGNELQQMTEQLQKEIQEWKEKYNVKDADYGNMERKTRLLFIITRISGGIIIVMIIICIFLSFRCRTNGDLKTQVENLESENQQYIDDYKNLESENQQYMIDYGNLQDELEGVRSKLGDALMELAFVQSGTVITQDAWQRANQKEESNGDEEYEK